LIEVYKNDLISASSFTDLAGNTVYKAGRGTRRVGWRHLTRISGEILEGGSNAYGFFAFASRTAGLQSGDVISITGSAHNDGEHVITGAFALGVLNIYTTATLSAGAETGGTWSSGEYDSEKDELLSTMLVCDLCGKPAKKTGELQEVNGFQRCKDCIDEE